MDLRFSAAEEAFRADARAWLTDRLSGPFAGVRGRGGPGDEHSLFEERWEWERALGDAGWTCLAWPETYGGRDATLLEQVIFYEEYARAGGPGRVGLIGEGLIGPTILHFGTEAQRERFLPRIASGEELWCQGYSEPNAGSDLANLATRAHLEDDEWVIDGQKVWTSLAHVSHWCFVVARTEPGSQRHQGLTFLMVPMDQAGVEVRPIRQITGGGEFNETFFTEARTEAGLVVGAPGDGWRIAMALLGYERGISTLAQQVGFERELEDTIALARHHGRIDDPVIRQKLSIAHTGLHLMKWNALRSMSAKGVPGPEASISKLFWGTWHRDLGELMIEIMGPHGLIGEELPYELSLEQKLFLFTRSDTIYGGSNEIQRNVLGERVLGLPK